MELLKAARNGQIEIELLKAARNGQIEIVRRVLKDNNMTEIGQCCIIVACMEGHAKIVRMLLDDRRLSNPGGILSEATIIHPARNGNTEIVKMLLVDGRANPYAINYLPELPKHMFKLFLRSSRVREALRGGIHQLPSQGREAWRELVDEYNMFLSQAEEIIGRITIKEIKATILGMTNLISDYSLYIDLPEERQIEKCLNDMAAFTRTPPLAS